jgi:Na+-translocating ferredoxin:NAD+ oxidoreductase RnfG subunit
MLTADTIKAKREEAENKAYEIVMPDAGGFENVDFSSVSNISKTVKAIKKAKSGSGYVVKVETKGYANGLVILIAVNPEGVITAATCVSSNETYGLENEMNKLVVGTNAQTIVDVKAGVTSATINGYRGAVRDALNALILVGGGEVDNRTEAEIFEDRLEEAIGDEEADFENVYVVGNNGNIYTNEDLQVKFIHKATNGKGYVFVIENNFIGIDSEGNVIGETEVTEANKAIIDNVLGLISDFAYEDVDIEEYKNSVDKDIKKAFRSINYVKKNSDGISLVEITATGYNTNVKIVMLVTIDADGKIIDNYAISHSESGDFGAKEFKDGNFNANFNGKTEEEANGVDTVAGVTVSTKAYKDAILKVFKAMTILEGGA